MEHDKCLCEWKKPIINRLCEGYFWNICACDCGMDCDISEYLNNFDYMKSLADDLAFTCDEILDTLESELTNPRTPYHETRSELKSV